MDEDKLILKDGGLKRALECMLFVSPQPLSTKHIAESLEMDEADVESAVHELRLEYADRGLQILRIAGGYQMCTRPEYGRFIARLHEPERFRLSRAALETLAIVAYRQPATRPEIEAIRGVNVDGVISTLLQYRLIRECGRKDAPGRPMLYGTTEDFLQHFGLNTVRDLPELDTLPVDESVLSAAEVSPLTEDVSPEALAKGEATAEGENQVVEIETPTAAEPTEGGE